MINVSISNQCQYQQLKVIDKSKELCLLMYKWCNENLPEKEKYGLWSQMTRCAVSIPSNLAEGQQRRGKDFLRFANIAKGSLEELKVQFSIAINLYDKSIAPTVEMELIWILMDEVGKMIYGLILKLKSETDTEVD